MDSEFGIGSEIESRYGVNPKKASELLLRNCVLNDSGHGTGQSAGDGGVEFHRLYVSLPGEPIPVIASMKWPQPRLS